MRTPTLTHVQLCNVINYILGLPVKRNPCGVLVRRDPISPCVVYSWGAKRMYFVENWVDAVLRTPDADGERVIGGTLLGYRAGRSHPTPKELFPWLPVREHSKAYRGFKKEPHGISENTGRTRAAGV